MRLNLSLFLVLKLIFAKTIEILVSNFTAVHDKNNINEKWNFKMYLEKNVVFYYIMPITI